MHITRDDEAATWTFIATNNAEGSALADVATNLSIGEKLAYNGRNESDPARLLLHFNAGGRGEWVTRGNVTLYEYIGGSEVELVGTSDEDNDEVGSIRDTCFFGSSGLILLKPTEVDGKPALVFTAEHCKLCNAPIIKMGRCEWSTCDACVEKCDHQYDRMPVHGGGIEIGVGKGCQICGFVPPDASDDAKTPLQHAVDAEVELGIPVYAIGTGMTARELATAAQSSEN